MKNKDTTPTDRAESPSTPAYEAPVIEETITPEELDREVHYAGDGTELSG